MNLFEAVILGVVQGLTEFLPVSSSGHLVLGQHILGLREPQLVFDIVVHLGTLVAVFVYFWKDIRELVRESFAAVFRARSFKSTEHLFRHYPYARLSLYLLLAMIPTGVIAVAFKDWFESLFSSLLWAGIGWIVTGIILTASRGFQFGNRTLDAMKPLDAVLIGLAQGIAIIPSISRSGTTILAGMAMGIEKKAAARFSFWLSIPAILGAAVFELKEGLELFRTDASVLLTGFAVSGVVGYLTIAVLLRLIEHGRFYIFGYYCLALGLFTTAVAWLNK